MQHGLESGLLLDQNAQRQIAHASGSAGTIGNVDGVDSSSFQILCAFHFFAEINPLRRDDLDQSCEFTGRNLPAEIRSLGDRRRRDSGLPFALAQYLGTASTSFYFGAGQGSFHGPVWLGSCAAAYAYH